MLKKTQLFNYLVLKNNIVKKIIKLTESDLTRIVERVISENQSKVDSLINMIKSDGLNYIEKYFGNIENAVSMIDGNLTKSDVYDILTKRGYPTALKVAGGVGNFIEKLEVDSPDDFLKLFDNLKSDIYEPNPQWSFLKDHNGTKIIGIQTYPSGNRRVSFNNKILGGVLSYVLDVPPYKVDDVLSKWLKDTYGIEADAYTSSGGFSEG